MGVLLRVVVPLVTSRLALGWRPSDYGLVLERGHRAGAVRGVHWVYIGLFVAMLPVLVLAAQGPGFMAKYPLAHDIVDPNGGIWIGHLIVYQLFYFLIFLSGESLWRGFMTFGCERDLGLYGLAFMAVPYVTGHFGKPMSETMGAIVAGCVLGFLALRHRSIWWGVALHYAIALSMDLLSIFNNGYVVYS
jgi:membrane protease YdiL (CAAX protease family)